jgi:hypothetical protein
MQGLRIKIATTGEKRNVFRLQMGGFWARGAWKDIAGAIGLAAELRAKFGAAVGSDLAREA